MRLNIFLGLAASSKESTLRVASEVLSNLDINLFGERGFIPHCTLYLTEFPDGVLSLIECHVAGLGATQGAMTLPVHSFEITPSGWVFLKLGKVAALGTLVARVVETLNPLRSAKPTRPSWLQSGSRKERRFEEFGSPNVGDEFEPHISLGIVNSAASPQAVAKKLSRYDPTNSCASLEFTAIGLAKADAEGQFAEIVGLTPLKAFE